MHPAAFLALLVIAMLVLAAFRLELDFRRTSKSRPTSEPRSSRPELRVAPAGGYCQTRFSAAAISAIGEAKPGATVAIPRLRLETRPIG